MQIDALFLILFFESLRIATKIRKVKFKNFFIYLVGQNINHLNKHTNMYL